MKHVLKCWPEYFELITSGVKTFELRKNDRNFQESDTIQLMEWDNKKQIFTAMQIDLIITYVLKGAKKEDPNYFGIEDGYVILGIREFGI